MVENQDILDSIQSEQEVVANYRLIHLADVKRERLLADEDDEEEASKLRPAANNNEADGSSKGSSVSPMMMKVDKSSLGDTLE